MGFAQHKRILKIRYVLVVVGLLSVVVYFALNPGTYQNVLKNDYYTVVIDCGSTGSRVNVYKWRTRDGGSWSLAVLVHSFPDNSINSPIWRNSCHYHCMQTEPGLDKFVGNSTGVRTSLEPLITWAEKWVPQEMHEGTPLFVLATGGMRRLVMEDARQVLDDVEAVVKEHPFMYRRSWIRVLSGKEEAYCGWVALNYKMGSFGNASRFPTLGLLDMGGSSLQIVMEVDGAGYNQHLIRSKIGSFERNILAFSLPAFGLTEAFDRALVLLCQVQPLQRISGRLKLRHPCLSSEFMQNYTCYSYTGLNIIDQRNSSIQMQKTEYTSIYIAGDSNWEQCRKLARAAAISSRSLNWLKPPAETICRASSSSYSHSDVLALMAAIRPAGRFHALSGFFAVSNMLSLSSTVNMTKMWEKGQQLCSRTSADLHGVSGNQNYPGQYCFGLPYIASILEDALCLGDPEITFGPGDLSWTLGAALLEGEFLWLSTTESWSSISTLKNMTAISSPIFLFVFLLCLLLIVYHSQIKLPMPCKKGPTIGASSQSYLYPKRPSN